MKDLMLDIETLGTGSLPVITQIGACYFDRATGKVGKTFLKNIDIESALAHGFRIDGATVKWWFEQEKRTFLENTEPLLDVLKQFLVFSTGAQAVWCHATFDFPIVMNAYKKTGLPLPFHYTRARDIRTLFDLSGGVKADTKSEKTHDALEDCLHQVEYCTEYFKKICC